MPINDSSSFCYDELQTAFIKNLNTFSSGSQANSRASTSSWPIGSNSSFSIYSEHETIRKFKQAKIIKSYGKSNENHREASEERTTQIDETTDFEDKDVEKVEICKLRDFFFFLQ